MDNQTNFEKQYSYLRSLLIDAVGKKLRHLEKTGSKNASTTFLRAQDEKIALEKRNLELFLSDKLQSFKTELADSTPERIAVITDNVMDIQSEVDSYLKLCDMRYTTNILRLKKQDVLRKIALNDDESAIIYKNVLNELNDGSKYVIDSLSLADFLNCFPFLNTESANKINNQLLQLQGAISKALDENQNEK